MSFFFVFLYALLELEISVESSTLVSSSMSQIKCQSVFSHGKNTNILRFCHLLISRREKSRYTCTLQSINKIWFSFWIFPKKIELRNSFEHLGNFIFTCTGRRFECNIESWFQGQIGGGGGGRRGGGGGGGGKHTLYMHVVACWTHDLRNHFRATMYIRATFSLLYYDLKSSIS